MKKFFIFCLMAFVMCSCNFEQKRIAEEREKFVADSIAQLSLKKQLLATYGEKIVSKYESYTTFYFLDNNCKRIYLDFTHYSNDETAFFYCEQLKKLEKHIDFSIKTKCINELQFIKDYADIVQLKKLYRLYAKYGYDGVFAINEWQPIDEVERLINKRWDNRPYGEGGDSDFIKSVVNKYY